MAGGFLRLLVEHIEHTLEKVRYCFITSARGLQHVAWRRENLQTCHSFRGTKPRVTSGNGGVRSGAPCMGPSLIGLPGAMEGHQPIYIVMMLRHSSKTEYAFGELVFTGRGASFLHTLTHPEVTRHQRQPQCNCLRGHLLVSCEKQIASIERWPVLCESRHLYQRSLGTVSSNVIMNGPPEAHICTFTNRLIDRALNVRTWGRLDISSRRDRTRVSIHRERFAQRGRQRESL